MIQELSHIQLSYLLMEIILVLIYWMMNTLQSPISLIQPKIRQPVFNFRKRLRKMCGSYVSMEKIPSHTMVPLMSSRAIILDLVNTGSISVYTEGIYIRGQILKIFSPDLINSYLWFHILKLFSQTNFSPQITLVNLLKSLRDHSGKNIYLWNMTRIKMSTFFYIP